MINFVWIWEEQCPVRAESLLIIFASLSHILHVLYINLNKVAAQTQLYRNCVAYCICTAELVKIKLWYVAKYAEGILFRWVLYSANAHKFEEPLHIWFANMLLNENHLHRYRANIYSAWVLCTFLILLFTFPQDSKTYCSLSNKGVLFIYVLMWWITRQTSVIWIQCFIVSIAKSDGRECRGSMLERACYL